MPHAESKGSCRATVAALACITLVAACGPSGGEGDNHFTLFKTSLAAEDGSVSSAGRFDATSVIARVGDVDSETDGEAWRVILSFDISTVPANATVKEAALTVYYAEFAGNPIPKGFGIPVVRHVDSGLELDGSDYDLPLQSLGTVPLEPESIGSQVTRSADVAEFVQDALAMGRTRFQVQILWTLMESNGDLLDDFVAIRTGEQGAPGQPPTLNFGYTVP